MKNVQHTTALVLILVILTASIFGVMVMNHASMACDPASPDSTCPPSQIGMAFHHISTYEDLMQAAISPIGMNAFYLMLFIVVAFVAIRYALTDQTPDRSWAYVLRDPSPSISQYRRLSRWIALFENSPSA